MAEEQPPPNRPPSGDPGQDAPRPERPGLQLLVGAGLAIALVAAIVALRSLLGR